MAYSSFMGNFKEAARTNRFLVSGGPFDSTHAKATSLPGHTIGICELWHEGRSVKLAGDRTTEDWNVTFYLDQNAKMWKELKEWHNACLSINNDNIGAPSNSYTKTLMVSMTNRSNSVIPNTITTIHGAWITNLSAVDLDMSTNDTPAEVSCTIAYNYTN